MFLPGFWDMTFDCGSSLCPRPLGLAPLHIVNSVLQQNSFCLLKGKAQGRSAQPGILFFSYLDEKIVFQCKMANDTLVICSPICKLQKYKGKNESGTGA